MPKLLVKMNDDLYSDCRCALAYAADAEGVLSPWDGAGWMFGCVQCRGRFVFATPRQTSRTAEELAERRLSADGRARSAAVRAASARTLAAILRQQAAAHPIGARVVFLDGHTLAADARDVRLVGLYAMHDFDRPPQATAGTLDDLGATLRSAEYWRSRAHPPEETS